MYKFKKFLNAFLLGLILVSYQYTCTEGDTVMSISKDWSPNKCFEAVRQFSSGIRELNYDKLGLYGEPSPGMVIQINRFEEKEDPMS